MKNKKSKIDWPAIRSDWEKSDWSIRRIAEWYQVSESGIRKKSREEKWPDRAKSAQKKVRTDKDLKQAPVVIADAEETKPEDIVGRGHNLIFRLLDELDASTTHQGELEALIEAHEGDPKRKAAMMKAIDLPGRANVVKALATAFKTWNESQAPEGKKAQRQAKANQVASGGKFAPRSGPRLAVKND